MDTKAVKGISFPFRIGGKGGVVTSTASATDLQRYKESITQIVKTFQNERLMIHEFGSEVLTGLFENYDDTTKNMIIVKLKQTLQRWEPRVSITTINISVADVASTNGTQSKDKVFLITVVFYVDEFKITDQVTINFKLAG